MLKNYLKITLRNLRKNKWFSLINVLGLTIGITGGMIIYLYITQELSFDRFHAKKDRIYRVTRSTKTASGIDYESSVPYPLIGALKTDFSQFENSTQVHLDDRPLVTYELEKHIIEHVVFADSNFFDVFDFEVITGNVKKSLGAPNYCFLSQSTAQRIFGDEDPIGEKITLRNKLEVEVAGILNDVPVNSHLQFEILVSYPSFSGEYLGLDIDYWTMSAEGNAYVVMKPGASTDAIDREFNALMDKHYTEDDARKRSFYLQPLTDIHYNSVWNDKAISTTTLWGLGVIGAFILLVGCVNFINLSTALAVKKSKEVGVRKTLGAVRRQLIMQYLSDTFIVSFVSGCLAVAFAERLVPFFNQYFDKTLVFDFMEDAQVLLFVMLLVVIVTIIAGIYPALVLSNYNPVKALKSNIHSQSPTALFLRKGLIVLQFVISQILIICTIIIASQMDYFMKKPLGFDKEAIITVDISKNDQASLETFKERILANSNVTNLSFALAPPVTTNTIGTNYFLTSEGVENSHSVQIKPADFEYLDTYALNLKYGSWFTPSEGDLMIDIFNMEKEEIQKLEATYILNETAVKKLGFEDPEEAIGKNITTGMGGLKGPIVGVMEDYHLSSLHEEIVPAIIMNMPMFYYNVGIKINMSNAQEIISHVERVFQDMFPDEIFEYQFLDDEMAEMYAKEKQTYNLFQLFSILSIVISCMGLLGMIFFIVNQRTKEVGIRKVLGAKVTGIVMLFSKDFLKLVFLASVISAPVAWYVMNLWLADFAYKIDMQVWFFLLAICLSALITFFTIGYQSFRAAIANPVTALKDE